jgi:hypothetical protein
MHQMMLIAMTRSAVSAIMANEELAALFQKYLTQRTDIKFGSPLDAFQYHVKLCNNAEPLPVLIGKLANISNALADPFVCNSASGHDPRVMNGAVNLDSCPEYSITNLDLYSVPPQGRGGGMRFRAITMDSHLCTSNRFLSQETLAQSSEEICTIPFSTPHQDDVDYGLGLGLAECKYECNITRMAIGPRQECTWGKVVYGVDENPLKPLESRLDCNKVNCLWSDDGVVNDKANPKCFQREACPMEAPWYFQPDDVKRACIKQGCFYLPPNYHWTEPLPTLPPPTLPPSSSEPLSQTSGYCRVSLNPELKNFSDQMCEENCHNNRDHTLCDDNCVCSLAPDAAHGGGPVPSCFLPHQDVSCIKDDPTRPCPLQTQLGANHIFPCYESAYYCREDALSIRECPAESFFSGYSDVHIVNNSDGFAFSVFRSCAQCDHGIISPQCSKAWDSLLKFKVVPK